MNLIKHSVPSFAHLAANKIFNTGKSVDFLRRLGWEKHRLRQDPTKEVAMTYEFVCQSSKVGFVIPFAELFEMAFNSWVARRHQACSSELLVQVETRCGLQSTLDDLEYIYFANGAMNTKVNNMLFEKMDRVDRR